MGILAPLSFLYSGLTKLRNYAFDSNMIKSQSVPVPIISVGNITLGGTGKTPIILHLIEWSLRQGLSPGVISRGYKGKFNGAQRVDLNSTENPPRYFGDEPTMIATNFPGVPVYVCPNRLLAAESLLKENQVDLIFADDAFQHRQMQRDLDVVVVDVLEPLKNYKILPDGRARESIKGLERADFIILNKTNMVAPAKINQIKNYINKVTKKDLPFIECKYILDNIFHIGDQQQREVAPETRCLLISGVGRPESFGKLIADNNIFVVHHMDFGDHFNYQNQDIDKIFQRVRQYNADIVIMTEKDAVKILNLSEDKVFCYAKLKLEFDEKVLDLYEKINPKNT